MMWSTMLFTVFKLELFVEEDESGDSNEVWFRRNSHDGGVAAAVSASSGGSTLNHCLTIPAIL
jgi:hypothetical protein